MNMNINRVPTQVLKGIIMSYFRFYIYKAIRKVLFLPIFSDRSYKGLIFGSRNFNDKKLASYTLQFHLSGFRSERGNVVVNRN